MQKLKTGLSFILLVIISLMGTSQIMADNHAAVKKTKGYQITLKVKGKTDSMVIMGNYWADRSVAFDTAYYNAKKKSWIFKGEENAPRGIYFMIFENRTILEFIMNDNQVFTIKTDTAENYLKNLGFEGSEENARYTSYRQESVRFSKEIHELNQNIRKIKVGPKKEALQKKRKKMYEDRVAYMKQFIADNTGDVFARFVTALKPIDVPKFNTKKDTIDTSAQYHFYKAHYWDNFNFSEEGLVRTPEKMIFNKINSFFTSIIPQHPDSAILYAEQLLNKTRGSRELDKYFIFRITQIFDTMQLMCMDKVFVHMADKYYLGGRAFWADSGTLGRMQEAADKRRYTNCGKVALDLNHYDMDSVPQRLYDHKGSKYTIVVFYDPTCGHCRKEMPILHDLYQKKKTEGWEVYAIASSNKKKEWKKYINEDNPSWKDWVNVCDIVPYRQWVDNRLKYNIIANPTILLLDAEGRIIAKKIPAANILPFVERYEKAPEKFK